MGRYRKPETEAERLEQERQKQINARAQDDRRNKAKRVKRQAESVKKGNVLFTGDMAEETPAVPSRKQPSSSSEKEQDRKAKNHMLPSSSGSSSLSTQEPHTESHSYEDSSGLDDICFELQECYRQRDSAAMRAFAALEHQAFIAQELEDVKLRKLKEVDKKKPNVKTVAGEDLDTIWQGHEPLVTRTVVEFHTSPSRAFCDFCSFPTRDCHTKCLDCSLHLCPKCDFKVHFALPFHDRTVFKLMLDDGTRPAVPITISKQLIPTQFLDSQFHIFNQDVPVPVLRPQCVQCHTPFAVIAGKVPCQVIGTSGRVNLSQAEFQCTTCGFRRLATLKDYVLSDIWPANPNRLTFFVRGKLIRLWFQLKFFSPGTSLETWLESLSALSAQAGRDTFISAAMFAKACKAHDFFNFSVDKEVKNRDSWNCRPCTAINGESDQLLAHIDGNQKLTRLFRENELAGRSWFEGELIIPQKDFEKFKNEINAVKPQAKSTLGAQKSLCGNSDWQAAREVSKRYKHLDETGVVTGCCGHGTMQAAVNMKEGETYRHTLCVQRKMHDEKKAKFVVSDVICKFWPFLLSLISLLPALGPLYNDMRPFLSRLHGKAHAWHCQALWFGHWMKGAAGSVGEEMEQVFSWFSRFSNVTHRMTSANRDDHLTLAAAHWNARKEARVAHLITRKLLNAVYRAWFYQKLLQKLLQQHNLTEAQLPVLHHSLQQEARDYLDKNDKASSHLTDLQMELEGLHYEVFNLEEMVKSTASTSKWKTKLIARQRKMFDKAAAVMGEINEILESSASELVVTDAHFKDGIFPWEPADSKPFKVNFRVVDCWMLRDRNREQIAQSHTEMNQLLRSLEREINTLQDQIREIHSCLREETVDLERDFKEGCANLKTIEISRLKTLLADALTYSKYYSNDKFDFDTLVDLDSDEECDD